MTNAKVALQRLRTRAGAIWRGVRRRRSLPRLPLLIILMVLLMVGATTLTFRSTLDNQHELSELRTENRHVRVVQQALLDLETGARGYVLTRELSYLQPFHSGLLTLEANDRALALLDANAREAEATFSAGVEELRGVLTSLIAEASQGSTPLELGEGLDLQKAIMDRLRRQVAAFLEQRLARIDELESHLDSLQRFALSLQIFGGAVTLLALVFAFHRMRSEAVARTGAAADAVRAREQVEQLFAMTDILQSANGYADANRVLVATARRLLPQFGGALYIFNNSRDRLDLSISWSSRDEGALPLPAVIAPDDCWAMKRGKWHQNEPGPAALRCDHELGGEGVLELPMLARGEVYGLLQLIAEDEAARLALPDCHSLASALADGMSLALAGIALRERLRNQALRDSLTGLYNRRFMEEVLERFALQAERRNTPIAAIMIDLDHFKRLNDEHGHAMGDAVLRDVAGTIVSALRASDVGCRYGGEELLVLLPDTDLTAAVGKAEVLRSRIAEVSGMHGIAVTASLGVAAIPETAANAAELLKAADAALYEAKRNGRDQVAKAPFRSSTPQIDLVPDLQRSGTG